MSEPSKDRKWATSSLKNSDDLETGAQTYTVDVFDEHDSGVDPVYHAKAKILNDAFQEIGMGKYQVGYPFLGMLHDSKRFSTPLVVL